MKTLRAAAVILGYSFLGELINRLLPYRALQVDWKPAAGGDKRMQEFFAGRQIRRLL